MRLQTNISCSWLLLCKKINRYRICATTSSRPSSGKSAAFRSPTTENNSTENARSSPNVEERWISIFEVFPLVSFNLSLFYPIWAYLACFAPGSTARHPFFLSQLTVRDDLIKDTPPVKESSKRSQHPALLEPMTSRSKACALPLLLLPQPKLWPWLLIFMACVLRVVRLYATMLCRVFICYNSFAKCRL